MNKFLPLLHIYETPVLRPPPPWGLGAGAEGSRLPAAEAAGSVKMS